MIAILKNNASEKQIDNLIMWFENKGLKVNVSHGENHIVLGLVGDTTQIDIDLLLGLDIIDNVKRVSEPYKKANRKFHPEDSVIDVGGVKVGGGAFPIIAGPCSVECEEQIITIAKKIKELGADMLRGGAFKPRTSPYSFQGLHEEGIRLLLEAKEETGLPVVSEIMDASQMPLFENIDCLQVGARNMQNFELLKEIGKTDKPVLLKRGFSNTLEELLMSAEYIMAGGNENVILCERGIRTFETALRNTLDLSCVPVLHELSHLPVVIDPSHATGKSRMIKPMALAAAACNSDGLEIEVHNDPQNSWSDAAQALSFDQFRDIVDGCRKIREVADTCY